MKLTRPLLIRESFINTQSKSNAGRQFRDIILDPDIWNIVLYSLSLISDILRFTQFTHISNALDRFILLTRQQVYQERDVKAFLDIRLHDIQLRSVNENLSDSEKQQLDGQLVLIAELLHNNADQDTRN